MFHACGTFKVALFTSSIPCRDKCFTRSAVPGRKQKVNGINKYASGDFLFVPYLVAGLVGEAIKTFCNVYESIKVRQLLRF